MIKRPSDTELREDMNKYARALLKAAYGGIVGGAIPEDGVKPDVFNAVATWIRTDAALEPMTVQKSGLELMTEGMKRGRSKG